MQRLVRWRSRRKSSHAFCQIMPTTGKDIHVARFVPIGFDVYCKRFTPHLRLVPAQLSSAECPARPKTLLPVRRHSHSSWQLLREAQQTFQPDRTKCSERTQQPRSVPYPGRLERKEHPGNKISIKRQVHCELRPIREEIEWHKPVSAENRSPNRAKCQYRHPACQTHGDPRREL